MQKCCTKSNFHDIQNKLHTSTSTHSLHTAVPTSTINLRVDYYVTLFNCYVSLKT